MDVHPFGSRGLGLRTSSSVKTTEPVKRGKTLTTGKTTQVVSSVDTGPGVLTVSTVRDLHCPTPSVFRRTPSTLK